MTEKPPADPALRSRRLRDAAGLLPLIGAVLFLPPAARAVALDATVLGVPVAVAYIFAVWAALIFVARVVSRPLRDDDARPPGTER